MSDKISRRNFLAKSAIGIISASTVFSTLNLTELLASSQKGLYTKKGEDLVFSLSDAANSGLSKVGGSVFFGNEEMILIRASQTQFIALSLICKHKGCTVEISGDRFVCPCHGSEYDMKGNVQNGPSKQNLDSFDAVYDPEKNTVTVKIPDAN